MDSALITRTFTSHKYNNFYKLFKNHIFSRYSLNNWKNLNLYIEFRMIKCIYYIIYLIYVKNECLEFQSIFPGESLNLRIHILLLIMNNILNPTIKMS